MSKAFRRTSWILGSLTVSSSIAAQAYVGHAKGYTDMEMKSLNSAQQIALINGFGLCLCATRKTKMVALPMTVLVAGTFMFSGVIFYSKIYKDYRFNRLIPMGGGASMVGWALMAFC
eukprot:403355248